MKSILALIGIGWGLFIVYGYYNFVSHPHMSGGYASGRAAAAVVGVLMFLAGLFHFMKGSSRR